MGVFFTMADTHSFSVKIAIAIGPIEAIVFQHIYFLMSVNGLNDKIDIRHSWARRSVAELTETYKYLSFKQIRTILDKLESMDIIVSDVRNKKGYDRTKSYQFTELGWHLWDNGELPFAQMGKWSLPNGQMELPKEANAIAQKGQPYIYNSLYFFNSLSNENENQKLTIPEICQMFWQKIDEPNFFETYRQTARFAGGIDQMKEEAAKFASFHFDKSAPNAKCWENPVRFFEGKFIKWLINGKSFSTSNSKKTTKSNKQLSYKY